MPKDQSIIELNVPIILHVLYGLCVQKSGFCSDLRSRLICYFKVINTACTCVVLALLVQSINIKVLQRWSVPQLIVDTCLHKDESFSVLKMDWI